MKSRTDTLSRRQRMLTLLRRSQVRRVLATRYVAASLLLGVVLAGCDGPMAQAPEPTQPPAQYLSGALDWVGEHAIKTGDVDWPSIRDKALAMAPAPATSADTYPALRFAVRQLGDGNAFTLAPGEMNAHVGP